MWISHEQCPSCAEQGRDNSHDNLGVHEDGHKYCFSCGYYIPSGNILAQFHSLEIKEKQNGVNNLPSDFSSYIPQEPLTWVKKYGITNSEIQENNLGYSHSKSLLVFPVQKTADGGWIWQGRYFGANPDYPKYVTYGMKNNVLHIIGQKCGTVVLTEDIISAIKVGRQAASMPLFGSDITMTQLFRLSRYYENIVVWLDPDKYQHGIKLGQRADLFFKKVKVVMSEKDPKAHSNDEVKRFIS